jgi:hypothetical protein
MDSACICACAGLRYCCCRAGRDDCDFWSTPPPAEAERRAGGAAEADKGALKIEAARLEAGEEAGRGLEGEGLAAADGAAEDLGAAEGDTEPTAAAEGEVGDVGAGAEEDEEEEAAAAPLGWEVVGDAALAAERRFGGGGWRCTTVWLYATSVVSIWKRHVGQELRVASHGIRHSSWYECCSQPHTPISSRCKQSQPRVSLTEQGICVAISSSLNSEVHTEHIGSSPTSIVVMRSRFSA